MKKAILATLLLAMLLTLTACGGTLRVGDTATVKIIKAYCDDQLLPADQSGLYFYYAADEGETFFIVEAEMKNGSDVLTDSSNLLYDLELKLNGNVYNDTIVVPMPDGTLDRYVDIAPGETCRVYCLFEIPDSDAGQEAELIMVGYCGTETDWTTETVTKTITPEK